MDLEVVTQSHSRRRHCCCWWWWWWRWRWRWCACGENYLNHLSSTPSTTVVKVMSIAHALWLITNNGVSLLPGSNMRASILVSRLLTLLLLALGPLFFIPLGSECIEAAALTSTLLACTRSRVMPTSTKLSIRTGRQ